MSLVRTRPTARPFLAATRAFAAGADTPRAFLERCLEAVAALEPEIGAFVTMDAASARAAADASAARWAAGRPLSPIDGMPLGIKDIIETADMPTGMGSPLFEGWRSERDAAAVKALREAGGVVLGKTVTTEFAAVVPGATRNPWDTSRTPGGSSSGSAAAVAAGMVSAALGTQVVGSTIRPASYCGCFGFKPSVGGLNRGGSHDYLSQSCTGVLAGTLADTWQVAREVARRAGGDPGFAGLIGPDALPSPVRPPRLALLETPGWAEAGAEAKRALEGAVARLAAEGVEIRTRGSDSRIDELEEALAQAVALTRRINAWESRWPLNTYRDRDPAKLSRVMLDRLVEAEAMTQQDYAEDIAERARIRALHAALRPSFDAFVTLSAPDCAPVGLQSTGDPSFAVPASLLGTPAVSLPVLSAGGLPLGLQLVGYADADAELFAHAAWAAGTLGGGDPA
ncbi:amidase [Propylenella binzhouense]|uniref:Amidase n=1 Tax=Propylenella binzhouense TaxID=2555902 RepID=A0A964T2I9_9HYPH|nr:amidase [Propylenella binzhouense]MYZ47251.1 amidase [Propylenella binzhouense]